ncbi:hypothetical protein M0R45_006537 [Rubus argutus]|uniref:Uncharacterized protein n=1 Tax=Rubus argutus TaxID=59490 RepID=A0AAW1YQM2_RUBAR
MNHHHNSKLSPSTIHRSHISWLHQPARASAKITSARAHLNIHHHKLPCSIKPNPPPSNPCVLTMYPSHGTKKNLQAITPNHRNSHHGPTIQITSITMAGNQQTKSPKSARRKREELSCRLESQKPAPTQVSPSDHDAAICTKRPHQSLAVVYVKSGNPMTSPTPIRRAQPGFLSPVPLPCSDAAAAIVVVPCALPSRASIARAPSQSPLLPPQAVQSPTPTTGSSIELPPSLPAAPVAPHLFLEPRHRPPGRASLSRPDRKEEEGSSARTPLPHQSLSPPPSIPHQSLSPPRRCTSTPTPPCAPCHHPIDAATDRRCPLLPVKPSHRVHHISRAVLCFD